MSAFVLPPDAGNLVWLGIPGQGLGVHFKVTGESTGGAFSIVEHPIPPGAMAFPHTHAHEGWYSFVLEGEVGVRIGDEEVTAGPGTYILKPGGSPCVLERGSCHRSLTRDNLACGVRAVLRLI